MAAPLLRRFSHQLRTCLKTQQKLRYVSSASQQTHETNGDAADSDKRSETHFGFQSVLEEDKEKKVHEVFSNVAETYDVMNDVMSGGLHRVWKDVFMERLSPSPGTRLLDVAGGTGDIAMRFLKSVNATSVSTTTSDDIDSPLQFTSQVYPDTDADGSSSQSSTTSDEEAEGYRYIQPADSRGSHVTVSDINSDMLRVGKEKILQRGQTTGISWIEGNAEKLPFSDNEFDAYTIAFGIRNCTHVQEVLNEAYRVLKPGGRFLCLEFSEVKNTILRSVYDKYSFQVIPVMGQLIADDWKSYQYLVESIRRFPNQEEFANMIKAAGFRMVKYENLTFGVVAIHSGFKI